MVDQTGLAGWGAGGGFATGGLPGPTGPQPIWNDPMAGFNRMGDAFGRLPTDPVFMTSLGLLTNGGRLSPGMAQNAVLMQQMQDRRKLTAEERKRLEEKERKARNAQLAYAKGLLQATGGAPANSGTGLLGQQVDQETLQRAAAMVLDPSAGVRRMMPHLFGGYLFPNGGPPGGGGAPLPPTGPSAQQQIQGLLAPADQAMQPMMQGPLPFDRAPAGEGQPFGADLVGPDVAKQRLLAANLAMMQNGTVEQAAEAQSAIEKMLAQDSRIYTSKIDKKPYWISGPLYGQEVLPNVKPPEVSGGPVPFFGAKEDKFVRQVREMWKPVIAANPGLTQADADRFGAIMSTLDLDELETTVLPDRTISRPGLGAQRAIRGFLGEVGPRAQGAPVDVQQKIQGGAGGFMPQGMGGGGAGSGGGGGVHVKPLQLGEADRLSRGKFLFNMSNRLEDSLEDFDATSLWNIGGSVFEAFPTLQALTTDPKWQRFNTNALRWSDVVLRIATGAQANKEEVTGFKQMFTPVAGESALNVANKAVMRYEETLTRLEDGLLRYPEGKQHPYVNENLELQRRVKTVDLPRARANLQRVEAGLKPFTRAEWTEQVKAAKARVRKGKAAREGDAPKTEPYQMTAPIFQRMRMEQERGRKKSVDDVMSEFGG